MLPKLLRNAPKKKRNKKTIKRSSKQKRKYSGKKKRHTHKIQMVIDAKTKQIISIHIGKGACHDFNLYKKTKLRIHPKIKQKVDSGYQGAKKCMKTQIYHKKALKTNHYQKNKRKVTGYLHVSVSI